MEPDAGSDADLSGWGRPAQVAPRRGATAAAGGCPVEVRFAPRRPEEEWRQPLRRFMARHERIRPAPHGTPPSQPYRCTTAVPLHHGADYRPRVSGVKANAAPAPSFR